MVRIISVFSAKGGVGKTVVSANLSFALSSKFRRNTALVDCNISTPHAALYLGIFHPKLTLNDYLRGEVSLDQAVTTHSINYTLPEGMRFVPASMELNDVIKINPERFKADLNDVFGDCEAVFLDSAPGLGREASAVLKASDELLFVTIPILPSVIDIVRCQEVLKRMGEKPIGVVVNMSGKSRRELSKSDIENFTGLKVISSIPSDGNVYESTFSGTPVYLMKRNSRASFEMARLAAYLIGAEYRESAMARIMRGLRLY